MALVLLKIWVSKASPGHEKGNLERTGGLNSRTQEGQEEQNAF
jgi:hypothetical protein